MWFWAGIPIEIKPGYWSKDISKDCFWKYVPSFYYYSNPVVPVVVFPCIEIRHYKMSVYLIVYEVIMVEDIAVTETFEEYPAT